MRAAACSVFVFEALRGTLFCIRMCDKISEKRSRGRALQMGATPERHVRYLRERISVYTRRTRVIGAGESNRTRPVPLTRIRRVRAGMSEDVPYPYRPFHGIMFEECVVLSRPFLVRSGG